MSSIFLIPAMLSFADFHDFCVALPGAFLCFPFDAGTAVFKVGEKMFALAPTEPFDRINLKCDPDKALELRAAHPEVLPGWHMNKKHWNTILLEGRLSRAQVLGWIQDSYNLVAAGQQRTSRREPAGVA